MTNNVPEFSYWEGEIGTPGLTINRHGRGEAVYLPWGVGRLYHLYGEVECRHLIGRLVERALGGPRTVLHLINSTGVESKPLLECVPVGPVAVGLRGRASTAQALVAGKRAGAGQGRRRCPVHPAAAGAV